MTKKETMKGILELLEKEKIGITVTRLSKKLDVSRPTIYKYLEILSKKGKVMELDLGGSKCWALRSSNSPEKLSIIKPYHYIVNGILTEIEKEYVPNIDWKNFGKHLARSINEEELLETDELFDILLESGLDPVRFTKFSTDPIRFESIDQISDFLMKLNEFFRGLFRLIFEFLDHDVNITLIGKDNSTPSLIYRLDVNLTADNKIIDIFSGLIEEKINTLFSNKIHFSINYEAHFNEKYINLTLAASLT